MTPEEIKNHFGIDITENKRNKLYIYLRAIYAKENIKKMHIKEIAENLKKDRTNMIYILKNYNRYKDDVYFKLILGCYQRKDKFLLEKSNEFLKEKAKEQNDYQTLKIKIKRLSKTQKVRAEKTTKERLPDGFKIPNIFLVAKNLRHKNTYLNNKVYNKWTNDDFITYNKLISE